ncbi:MAG: veratrol--corrinoid protein metyltransferase, partial [Oscillospiraceae bacterium]|nr:veratrol--corrinoid protein metyltransferase [Oscillospiraceae bacterium]
PRYMVAPTQKNKYPSAFAMAMPAFYQRETVNGESVDIWGVPYSATENTGGMALPTPGKFILDDIRKWRDVIKAPDLSYVDWEDMAKKGLAHVDRNETIVEMYTHVGYFQHLMNFMGFNEGLLALYEEPEECMALFEYLADFYDEVAKKTIQYYKPDIMLINDDIATAINPFISLDMYRELIKPYAARLGHIAMDAGIYVDMHCCGRCEEFIDDWMEFGVTMWNPAQVMNDLKGIKEKYGNKLTLIGCWDSSGPPSWPGATEELVREEVRKCIDTYAPGGGFIFWGSMYGADDDQDFHNRASWVADEYNTYGRNWYKTH